MTVRNAASSVFLMEVKAWANKQLSKWTHWQLTLCLHSAKNPKNIRWCSHSFQWCEIVTRLSDQTCLCQRLRLLFWLTWFMYTVVKKSQFIVKSYIKILFLHPFTEVNAIVGCEYTFLHNGHTAKTVLINFGGICLVWVNPHNSVCHHKRFWGNSRTFPYTTLLPEQLQCKLKSAVMLLSMNIIQ